MPFQCSDDRNSRQRRLSAARVEQEDLFKFYGIGGRCAATLWYCQCQFRGQPPGPGVASRRLPVTVPVAYERPGCGNAGVTCPGACPRRAGPRSEMAPAPVDHDCTYGYYLLKLTNHMTNIIDFSYHFGIHDPHDSCTQAGKLVRFVLADIID